MPKTFTVVVDRPLQPERKLVETKAHELKASLVVQGTKIVETTFTKAIVYAVLGHMAYKLKKSEYIDLVKILADWFLQYSVKKLLPEAEIKKKEFVFFRGVDC